MSREFVECGDCLKFGGFHSNNEGYNQHFYLCIYSCVHFMDMYRLPIILQMLGQAKGETQV